MSDCTVINVKGMRPSKWGWMQASIDVKGHSYFIIKDARTAAQGWKGVTYTLILGTLDREAKL